MKPTFIRTDVEITKESPNEMGGLFKMGTQIWVVNNGLAKTTTLKIDLDLVFSKSAIDPHPLPVATSEPVISVCRG